MTSLLVLWSVASAAVGILAMVVAVREHRRGSRWWLLPGVFGVLYRSWLHCFRPPKGDAPTLSVPGRSR